MARHLTFVPLITKCGLKYATCATVNQVISLQYSVVWI